MQSCPSSITAAHWLCAQVLQDPGRAGLVQPVLHLHALGTLRTPAQASHIAHAGRPQGRTGAQGQNQLFGPFETQQAAIDVFEDKFKDKTGQAWSARVRPSRVCIAQNLLKRLAGCMLAG